MSPSWPRSFNAFNPRRLIKHIGLTHRQKCLTLGARRSGLFWPRPDKVSPSIFRACLSCESFILPFLPPSPHHARRSLRSAAPDPEGLRCAVHVQADNRAATMEGCVLAQQAAKHVPTEQAFCVDAGSGDSSELCVQAQWKPVHVSIRIADGFAGAARTMARGAHPRLGQWHTQAQQALRKSHRFRRSEAPNRRRPQGYARMSDVRNPAAQTTR